MTKLIRLAFYGGVSKNQSPQSREKLDKGIKVEGEPMIIGFTGMAETAEDFVAIFDVTEVV